MYDLMQGELKHLAKLAKDGVRWTKNLASSPSLTHASSASMAR